MAYSFGINSETDPFTGMPVNGAGYSAGVAQFGSPTVRPTSLGMDTGIGLTAGGATGYMPPKAAGGAAGAGLTPGQKWGNGLEMFGNVAAGLGSLGQLYMGLKSLGIAKEQLAFSKEAYNTNLANTKKSYNTTLEDRIRSRYVTEGRTSGEADAYLSKNNM